MLPDTFKPYLWSYDFSKLDAKTHKKAIVLAILNYGSVESWSQLFAIYGESEVKNIFESSKEDTFNKKSYNFWKIKFNI